MTTQNYLVIENNIVTNGVVWDGNTETWTPPVNSTMLVQAETITMVWIPVVTDDKITDFVLQETVGLGSIGFTWDGSKLTTNQPKPTIPV